MTTKEHCMNCCTVLKHCMNCCTVLKHCRESVVGPIMNAAICGKLKFFSSKLSYWAPQYSLLVYVYEI